jgi:hypothetical protein
VAQKKTAHRTPWTNEDERQLKAYSKARTPLTEVVKKMKRTEGALQRRRENSALAWDMAADPTALPTILRIVEGERNGIGSGRNIPFQIGGGTILNCRAETGEGQGGFWAALSVWGASEGRATAE